jgi:hypothetical protein
VLTKTLEDIIREAIMEVATLMAAMEEAVEEDMAATEEEDMEMKDILIRSDHRSTILTAQVADMDSRPLSMRVMPTVTSPNSSRVMADMNIRGNA